MICSLCSFYFDKWLLRNIEFWKMCAWKSGRQLPARARVRSTIFPLFVRKKKDNQTTHGCIVAVSFILGPPGLQTYVFSQPNSGNCNLLVLMLFPLRPAFKIFYIWFSIFCHLSCHLLSSQSSCFPVGRFLSLGWGFGTFLAFDCRCLQRGAEDEKKQWNSCASCHSSPNMKKCFQHSKSNLGWILRCPHPGSWVLGPRS